MGSLNKQRWNLNVVGAGRAGQVIGRLLASAECIAIGDVANRSLGSARRAVEFMGAGRPCDIQSMQPADVWMFSVPDDQLAEASTILHRQDYRFAFHLSGLLPGAILGSGQPHASFHPARSLTGEDRNLTDLGGAGVGVEGDSTATDILEQWAADIGGKPFRLASHAKPIYHASCVLASNATTVLLALSRGLMADAGVDEALAADLVDQLARVSLDNARFGQPNEVLTGPVVRGDRGSITRHLEVLNGLTREVYVSTARAAVAMAREAERLDETTASTLNEILHRIALAD